MTAPLFWAPPEALAGAGAGAVVRLTGAEARHAVAAQRLRPGQPVLLSDAAGLRLAGRVAAAEGGLGAGEAVLAVAVERVERVEPRRPALALVQALAKQRRDEAGAAAATQLGADRIIPWQAERSVPRWLGAPGAKGRRRWQQVVRAEGQVARRALLPPVEEVVGSAALAERLRREIAGAGAQAVVLDESAGTALAQALAPMRTAGEVFLLVGPEGSITPQELAAFAAAGAVAARLGPEVLRTGLAGAAALAVASQVLGRWD
ncbi:MAG: 16S rRNA (uracil(1498)-N(3))-methyltransferase [Bifidobacteriaceae bacterium]|nr:16S rRNA (uracil(1498)-N(3))-methyltransferase [Bifidobacteriaceae bacterium]